MKRKTPRPSTVLAALLLLAGLGVMLFPAASNWCCQRKFWRETEAYDQFEGIDCDAMWAAAERYNQDLAARGDLLTLDEDEEAARAAGLLDPWGTGMMGYLDIPKIDVHIPIYQGTEESAIQAGAGHWQGTSLPVGGPSTHCVLIGHNGLVKAKMFTDLDRLAEGDTFSLSVLDRVLTYEVDQITVADPSDLTPMAIAEGEDYVTLYTCTPYGVNTHRLLVRGHRVEGPSQAAEPEEEPDGQPGWALIALAVLLLLLLMGLLFLRKPCSARGRGDSPDENL